MFKYFWLCLIPFILCAEEIPDLSMVTPEVQYYELKTETPAVDTRNYVQAEVIGKRLDEGTDYGKYYGSGFVISAAEINLAQSKTIPDLLARYGLGKYSNATGSNLDWNLNWRGVNQGNEVVVLLDGVRINEMDDNEIYWSQIPIDSLAKIEVISGAQSTLVGSGGFGGVIKLTSKKNKENSLRLAGGSFGYGLQELSLGVERGDFSYRLIGLHQAETGYREKSDYDQEHLSAQLEWLDHYGVWSLGYLTTGAKMHYPVQLTDQELVIDRTDSPINNTRIINSKITRLGYSSEYDPDFTWSLQGSGRDRQTRYTSISKGKAADDTKSYEIEQAKFVVGQFTAWRCLTLGYDHSLADIYQESFKFDREQNMVLDRTYFVKATKGSYAPFAQYANSLGAVYWRYGVREDSVDYVNYDELAQLRSEKKFQKRTHSGEIGWSGDKLTLFANYGEAFKAPSFSDLYRVSSAWAIPNPELLPELGRTRELGLRYLSGATAFSWTVFNTIIEDEITSMGDPVTWLSQNKNANKTQRQGFDLNLQHKLDHFIWRSNYVFTKARYLDFADGWGNDYQGYAIPMVPEQNISYGFGYVDQAWSLFVDNFIVDKQYLDWDFYNEMAPLPKYSYMDLSAAYHVSETWSFSGKINNLFNQLYSTKGLYWFNTADLKMYEVFTPADLRSVQVSCEAKF